MGFTANPDYKRETGFVPNPDYHADGSLWDKTKSAALETADSLVDFGKLVADPVGKIEAAANLGSQAIALPVAGLAGLGTAAANAVGLTDAEPGDVVRHVGNALTYEPHTEHGQDVTGIVTLPFQALSWAGSKAGDATLDATGSPAAAASVDTAINALPMLLAPGVKAAKGFTPKEAIDAAAPESAQAGEISLANHDSPVHGPQVQELQPVRGSGNSSVPGVDGDFRPLPAGHGAGADASTLAGAVERTGELRTGELPVDAAGSAGAAPDVLPEGFTPRPGYDGSGSRQVVTSDTGHVSPAPVERPTTGDTGQAVQGIEVADVPRANQAAAGVGQAVRDDIGSPVATDQSGMVSGSGIAATAPKGARYALIEASDIKPSHDENLRWTKDYPANFMKPGARRHDTGTRVNEIVAEFDPTRLIESPDDAAGAPMVAKDGIVETGNARAVAIKRIYEANGQKAADYREAIKAKAEALGIPAEAVDGMKAPVLVRVPDEPRQRMHLDEVLAMRAKQAKTLDSFAPGANYVPLVQDSKLPGAKATTTADLPAPIRREHIIADLAKALDTTVYQGRVKGKKLGFFRPSNKEVRIKRANDIEVTAHEIAHLIDDRVPAIANTWRSDKALREELKSVSYDRKSVQEGFAEAMRLFMTQPAELEARAPKAYAWLNSFADGHEYGPAIRKAQEAMTGWYGQDAINRARSKIGIETPWHDMLDRAGDKFRQATVDDLHGIYAMERALKGGIEPNGAYESARLSRASASIADSAIRYGYPVKKPDGSYTFAGKGLEEILRPVSENIEDAMLFFVGRSARELMAQGREHLFTPSEIDAMLRLRTPEREQAFRDYQDWNKGILDFAEANGVINPQARAMWQRTEYLPFHRVGQPGDFKGAKPGDWSGVKALTGGTDNIRDVLGNIIHNSAQLIDKATKNEARQKVADLADKNKGGKWMVKIDPETRPVKVDPKQAVDAVLKAMGIDRAEWRRRGMKLPKYAQKVIEDLENAPDFLEFMVGNPPAGGNVVAVLRDGKPTWYEVGDPILYRSLSSIDRQNQHWLIKWLGLPKRVGQATITATPDFWVANIARDTLMGSIMTHGGFKPILSSLEGMRLRMTEDPVYRDYLANGGGLSSIYLDETKLKAKLEKFYTRQGISLKTVLDTPEKLIGLVESVGDAFEMSTRLGEYKARIEAGDHPRHAAYVGREVSTDFAMRGDSQALGLAYDTIMFLKPAVLSIDRLIRGFAHDTNRGQIAIKAGAVALASVALYLQNRDNPQYQELPDWDKDANWHFFVNGEHFRYPKIWEIGAMASAAERTVERSLDGSPASVVDDFKRIFAQTFSLNLMPQIVAPLYEQATNKNSFTGAAIETPGMENEQPFLRAGPNTSETLKALGFATRDLPEGWQVNPVRTEALIRGYFNTWGMYALMLADQAAYGDKLPEKRADELPVIRRFYESEPAKHTQYEQEFYDLLGQAQRMHGTLTALDKMGRSDVADELQTNPIAGEVKPLERAAKNLSAINRDMRAVRQDPDLTPTEKREKLDALTVERNALLKQAVTESKAAQKDARQ